jgi:hypothetical protein
MMLQAIRLRTVFQDNVREGRSDRLGECVLLEGDAWIFCVGPEFNPRPEGAQWTSAPGAAKRTRYEGTESRRFI